jgi:hypothetical protein
MVRKFVSALALFFVLAMPLVANAASKNQPMNSATINSQIEKIGKANRELVLSAGRWAIDENITIPANAHLKLEAGATLEIAAGKILQINGAMDAPGLQRLFYGAGKVQFGAGFIGEVFPQWWGEIRGKDDTAACQSALDSGAPTIRFPRADYAISVVDGAGEIGGLKPNSDTALLFDAGAVLQAISTDKNDYAILNISGKDRVTIDGATIRGERKNHIGEGGEWGHGIRIRGGSTNIVVKNCRVSDCWGDGIYLGEGPPDGVFVENSQFDNNRRNGCSITSAKNVLFKKCTFSNSNGTSPFKGVDIEANVAADILQNLVFEDCNSFGNLAGGFSVARDEGQDKPVSITFRNCVSEKDGEGFTIDIGPSDCAGLLTIRDCMVLSPGESGFRCTSANLQTQIDGLYIFNPAQKKDARPQFASGISLWNVVPQPKGARKLAGNITARNVTVWSDDGKAAYALFMNNELGETSGFANLDLELKTNLPNEKRAYKGAGPYFNYCRIRFPDEPVVNLSADLNAAQVASFVSQTMTNAKAQQDIRLPFTDAKANSFGSVYTIEVRAPHKMVLDFGDASLLPANVTSCWSQTVGSRLKIQSDGKSWRVVEQIGDWHFGK